MENKDLVIFYYGQATLEVYTSIVPPEGSVINFRAKDFKVKRITYNVDYAEDMHEKRMRANVDLTPVVKGRGKSQ